MKSYKIEIIFTDAIETKVIFESLKLFKKTAILVNLFKTLLDNIKQMSKKNLQDSFIEFCKQNKFEINNPQIEIISLLDKFINSKKNILNRIFKTKNKLCFYLFGGVGVGKTMILNFVYDQLNIKKLRITF